MDTRANPSVVDVDVGVVVVGAAIAFTSDCH